MKVRIYCERLSERMIDVSARLGEDDKYKEYDLGVWRLLDNNHWIDYTDWQTLHVFAQLMDDTPRTLLERVYKGEEITFKVKNDII